MKILITAPSLDEQRNVSGISTVVRQIIEHSPNTFSHFQAGREDGERAGAAWLLRQATLPVRFLARVLAERPDIVHINTALTDLSIWRDSALMLGAKLAGRPVVLALHGGKYLLDEFESKSLERAAAGLLRRADTVVALSEIERRQIDRRWPGLNVQVLPNAVPVPQGRPSKPDNAVPAFIFLGRLHESKGLDEIAKACEALKHDGFDLRFNCFGDGPMKEGFVTRMNEILGGRFHYGGVIAGPDKSRELEKADIFLLPSLYGEGLPVAMLEAMAAGCVVVASEMASVSEVIEDGVNGYLIEPGNTAQLVGRLKALLDDRPNWKLVQNAASDTIRSRFSITEHTARLDKIYRSVTG